MEIVAQGKSVYTTFDNPGSTYIIDMANLFYQAKKSESLSPNTIVFYKQQLKHFLNYCDAQSIKTMGEISTSLLRSFLLWHEETGHDPGGLHAVYRVIKTFLRWYDLEAEPDNWKNPIRKIKAPKVPNTLLEPASIDSISKLVKTCSTNNFLDARDKALLMFLLDTGARAREVISIDLSDVNKISGEVKIRKGKGSKERTVYLGKQARKVLRSYLKRRAGANSALWVTHDNERISYIGLRAIVLRRAKIASIEAPPLHSFRRAFAINMLRAGTDLITLARLMGHADLTILQRYLKQMPDDLRAAHAKGSPVDNLLSPH